MRHCSNRSVSPHISSTCSPLQGDLLISLYLLIYLFVSYLHSVRRLGIKTSHDPNYGLHRLNAVQSKKDGWNEGGIAICKFDEETLFTAYISN